MKPFLHRFLGLIVMALWTCMPHIAAAQDLNDPAVVLKIMDKSDVAYQVMADPDFVAPKPVRGGNNIPYMYQEVTDDGPFVETYEIDSAIAPLYQAAEKAFAENNYAVARGKYLEINEMRPNMGVIITYLGQTYEAEQNYTEAIKWYKRAISVNFHDYMAHWFLADNYWKLKRYDEAAKEIAIAYVLNRNHESIRSAMIDIFKSAKLKWDGFEFLPQYSLQENGDKIEIRFQKDWMMYAFCKALWRYEPDYHRELGGGRSEFNMDEEKECLLNLAIGYERMYKGKKGKDATIDALMRAITGKQINAFIFMEIWLPREPMIAYTQSEGAILEMAEYVLKVRGMKK
jgi:tetratricopeptide (TPR) repeat protein